MLPHPLRNAFGCFVELFLNLIAYFPSGNKSLFSLYNLTMDVKARGAVYCVFGPNDPYAQNTVLSFWELKWASVLYAARRRRPIAWVARRRHNKGPKALVMTSVLTYPFPRYLFCLLKAWYPERSLFSPTKTYILGVTKIPPTRPPNTGGGSKSHKYLEFRFGEILVYLFSFWADSSRSSRIK